MEKIQFWGRMATVQSYDAIVIGSGCAGLNGADTLHSLGYTNIALVTEGMSMGTSRNTGSDKQTYYKLAWQSGQQDNVQKMAETLFSGKSVHGDIAFAEAANSIRCFMKLVNLGVPFPTNAFGEYVGYRTDHTTEKRATSAGPLTSKYMTEVLEKEVRRKNITVFDHMMIIKLVRDENGILGAVGMDTLNRQLHLFMADNVILATGGPAAIYENRVYPASQTGMTGLAVEAGAVCENLQEWQYGLASCDFRWNLSGTYQQVIPRYVSIDAQGTEREFLNDYFRNPIDALNQVFLKGYQWPFDSAKLCGSTVIDMIVYHEEIEMGRTVYLDYRTEPKALEQGLDGLSKETYEYLKQSDALLTTPIARLEKMNPSAVELYLSQGIDLRKQMLRITVAAQHCNGGVAVDANWQTTIPGLYAVGEVAATFGVYRPGGTALNSTQVGSLRAAEHIARQKRKRTHSLNHWLLCAGNCPVSFNEPEGGYDNCRLLEIRDQVAHQMSTCAAQLRNCNSMEQEKQQLEVFQSELPQLAKTADPACWFKTQDMMTTARSVLDSMIYAARHIGTRGGAICCQNPVDFSSETTIRNTMLYTSTAYDDRVLQYQVSKGCRFTPVRPLPKTELWFETVWEAYRKQRGE